VVNELVKAGALLISSSARTSKPQRQDTEILAARSHSTIISHGIARYRRCVCIIRYDGRPTHYSFATRYIRAIVSGLVMTVRCWNYGRILSVATRDARCTFQEDPGIIC